MGIFEVPWSVWCKSMTRSERLFLLVIVLSNVANISLVVMNRDQANRWLQLTAISFGLVELCAIVLAGRRLELTPFHQRTWKRMALVLTSVSCVTLLLTAWDGFRVV